MSEEKKELTIHYFGIKARGLPPVIASAYWGKQLVWEKYSFEDWTNNKNEIKSHCAFGQLPVLNDNGNWISQSMGITRYLGKKWKKEGSSMEDFKLSEILMEESCDILEPLVEAKFKGKNTPYAWDQALSKIPKHLENLQKLMTETRFASEVLMGDMALFSTLNIVLDSAPHMLDEYKNLKTWYDEIAGKDAVKAVLDTSDCFLVRPVRTNEVTFHYFGVKARGFPAVVGGAYWGKEFVWEKYTFDDWKNNKNEIKSQCSFGQLPVLHDNGTWTPQSMAIVRYLARKWEKKGSSTEDFILSETLIEESVDLYNIMNEAKYQGKNTPTAWDTALSKIPKHLENLEKLMTGTRFASEVLMGDMALFSSINMVLDNAPDMLDNYKNLKTWYDEIASKDAVKAVLDSSNIYMKRPDGDNTKIAVRTRLKEIIPTKLATLEKVLNESSSGFVVGDNLTIADFRLFCMLRYFNKNIMDHVDLKAMLENTPKLKDHSKMMLSLKSVDAWYKQEHKQGFELEKKGLELVYFNLEGRAEPIRLACQEAGVKFKDVRVDRDTFKKMKEDGVLPFGQLPVLFIEGVPLAQTDAILRYVGKEKLYPTDDIEAAKVDAFINQIEDLWTPLGITMHPQRVGLKFDPDGGNTKKAIRARASDILANGLVKVEKYLTAKSTSFLCSDSPTIADIAFLDFASFLSSNSIKDFNTKTLLDAAPKLKEHMKKMMSLKKVDTWFKAEHKGDGSELEMKGMELVYFDAKGRAESIRIALHFAGIEFRDVRLDRETFGKMKKNGLFPFGQVPALFNNGQAISQSKSILRYVGKMGESGLYPSDVTVAAQVDALVDLVDDVGRVFGIMFYPQRLGWKVDE